MKSVLGRKAISILLLSMVFFCLFQPVQVVCAAQKTISISQARKLALAGSDSYRRIKGKITLKEVSYEQAVKTLQLKKKNDASFRWSPLLSFSLPTEMNFEEESFLVYKPAQLQTEINQLNHSLKTEIYSIYEETEQSYLRVYTYQEKVAIEEKQLEDLKKNLKKNQGRVILGLAVKSDLEEIENRIQEAEEMVAKDKKNFINEKSRLGQLIGLDVSTGYTFLNPYITSGVPRTVVEKLVQHTLENDQSNYEAKIAAQLSMIQLTANYTLMEKKYSSEISIISSYIQQIKAGEEIDDNAFKTSYDLFLEKIEESWTGDEKILSVSIPKEWLKGENSGVRYIEDNPYALYENVLEFKLLLEEQKSVEKELERKVRESFENVVIEKNNCLKSEEKIEKSKNKLKKDRILLSMGEGSYEEYTELQREYENQQLEELDALEKYSSSIFQLDRLTCGAVSEYLNNIENSLGNTDDTNQYFVEEEEQEGARYYIQSLVEDNMFEFGIYLPRDFGVEITHYELRTDDFVIGKKTETGKTLRHLTLALTGKERVFVRLYNNSDFIDDCEIDPSVYHGNLDITEYVIKKNKTEEGENNRSIGTYRIINRKQMGLMEIVLEPDRAEGISFYSIQNQQGKSLISEDKKTGVMDSFTYLELSEKEMETLKIQCYDKSGTLKYTAYFNTKTYDIFVKEQ